MIKEKAITLPKDVLNKIKLFMVNNKLNDYTYDNEGQQFRINIVYTERDHNAFWNIPSWFIAVFVGLFFVVRCYEDFIYLESNAFITNYFVASIFCVILSVWIFERLKSLVFFKEKFAKLTINETKDYYSNTYDEKCHKCPYHK